MLEKTGNMRTGIARGVSMNDNLTRRYFPFFFGLADDLRNIIAYCFRKAGSMHRDNIRVIDGKDVIDGLHQVRLPAEDRRTFRKRTGAAQYLFLVVTLSTCCGGKRSTPASRGCEVSSCESPMKHTSRLLVDTFWPD